MALTMVTVTCKILQPDNVTPCSGSIIFTPGSGLLTSATENRILAGEKTVDLSGTGAGTVSLPATDNAGTQPEPNTWNWTVKFKLSDASIPPFSFALPASPSTVDLADVVRVEPAPGTYVVVPGPQGIQGPKGDAGSGGAVDSVNTQTGDVTLDATDVGADPAGAAATAQTAATTAAAADATTKANAAQAAATSTASADATAKVAAHTAASDPHGDRASASAALSTHNAATTSVHGIANTAALETGAGATAKVSTHTAAPDPHGDRAWATGQFDTLGAATTALASANTHSDTGDAATLSAAEAYTDAHTGGGITSVADDRIDTAIIVLTNVGTWTVVRDSGGTAIGKSVPAAAGDRVWVSPSFMYTGTQYQLDMAVMKGDGSVSRYASSSGAASTPGPEGYAPYYTQAGSFPHVNGLTQFIVGADEIDGDGNFTVNLAYLAPSLSGTDQKVYFGSGYLGRWLMANIGPAI